MYYSGTMRIKEVGTNSASRKARLKGDIKAAERIEARCMERHNTLIEAGWIYAIGCKRYRMDKCECCKCKRK